MYIHGIMSITPHLNVGNFMRFMNDNVLHTLYAKQVEFIRNDPFFQYAQAMQQIGLHKLDPENSSMVMQAMRLRQFLMK